MFKSSIPYRFAVFSSSIQYIRLLILYNVMSTYGAITKLYVIMDYNKWSIIFFILHIMVVVLFFIMIKFNILYFLFSYSDIIIIVGCYYPVYETVRLISQNTSRGRYKSDVQGHVIFTMALHGKHCNACAYMCNGFGYLIKRLNLGYWNPSYMLKIPIALWFYIDKLYGLISYLLFTSC